MAGGTSRAASTLEAACESIPTFQVMSDLRRECARGGTAWRVRDHRTDRREGRGRHALGADLWGWRRRRRRRGWRWPRIHRRGRERSRPGRDCRFAAGRARRGDHVLAAPVVPVTGALLFGYGPRLMMSRVAGKSATYAYPPATAMPTASPTVTSVLRSTGAEGVARS